MTERRHFIRWGMNKEGRVKLRTDEDFTRGTINDISLKGVKVCLKTKLPRDMILKLTIALSEDLCLDIEGWVAWHKTKDEFNSYGIYFDKLKDRDKEIIYQFIRRSFPDQINARWWRDIGKESVMLQDEGFNDRRIFGRFAARVPLRFINLRENREGEALTQDISAKGIGFLSSEELLPQTPVEMWLQVPDKGEPLYARGEVIWSEQAGARQHRMGINLEKADLMGLSRILRVA